MSSGKKKKKKQVRNKSKDWLMDYYKSGRAFDEENEKRRRSAGESEHRGLRNLNSFELGCVIVIVLGLIGCFIRYVVL